MTETTKPLSEVPPETLERWKKLSQHKPKKKTKRMRRRSFPLPIPMPSVGLLRAEIGRLRNADSPEEIREIQENIRELQDQVMAEGKEHHERKMQRADMLKRQRRMKNPPIRVTTTKYVCPKCGSPDLGNRMDGKPWCFKCQTQLVHHSKLKLGDTFKVKALRGKYPKNPTFREP